MEFLLRPWRLEGCKLLGAAEEAGDSRGKSPQYNGHFYCRPSVHTCHRQFNEKKTAKQIESEDF